MAATSDIFEHRNGRASRRKGAQPGPPARTPLVDERLIDELAQRLSEPLAPRLIDELAPRLIDKLAPLVIERLADRLGLTPEQLAERLGGPAPEQPEGLVDAREIARRTGRSRWWVYEHAGELGAVRLGSGSRPRLGFWPSRVHEYLDATAQLRQPIPAPARARPQRRRRGRRTSTGVELLPIQGHDA
jgi:hypothetical protein